MWMSFHITGLAPEAFDHLFGHTDAALAELGILRHIADADPGYPCRISLQHASVGEPVLLLPFEHLPARSPYRASGPIYVRRNATRFDAIDTLPDVLRRARLLSLRGYDAADLMCASDAVAPAALEATITSMLADPRIAYLHVHNARPGCFACRIDRATSPPGG